MCARGDQVRVAPQTSRVVPEVCGTFSLLQRDAHGGSGWGWGGVANGKPPAYSD